MDNVRTSPIYSGTAARARDKILGLRGDREAVVTSGVIVESLLPELVESAAGVDAAESQDVFGSRLPPEHPGLFAAGADDGLAPSFDDARTDEKALTAKRAVLHAFDVVDEVSQSCLDLPGV